MCAVAIGGSGGGVRRDERRVRHSRLDHAREGDQVFAVRAVAVDEHNDGVGRRLGERDEALVIKQRIKRAGCRLDSSRSDGPPADASACLRVWNWS